MPPPVSESRLLACLAISNATQKQWECSREWNYKARQDLHRHFENVTQSEATAVFDKWVLDHAKNVRKRKNPHRDFEADFIYDFYVDAEFGCIYFEFILNEKDPEDPLVLIVSCHPPSYRHPQ